MPRIHQRRRQTDGGTDDLREQYRVMHVVYSTAGNEVLDKQYATAQGQCVLTNHVPQTHFCLYSKRGYQQLPTPNHFRHLFSLSLNANVAIIQSYLSLYSEK